MRMTVSRSRLGFTDKERRHFVFRVDSGVAGDLQHRRRVVLIDKDCDRFGSLAGCDGFYEEFGVFRRLCDVDVDMYFQA